MTMNIDLRTRIRGDYGVASVAGADPQDDLPMVNWGDRVRDAPLPAITMLIVSPGRDYDHNGPTGEDEPRVQFDCWGTTAEEAAALADALRTCIEQPATVGGTRFEMGFLDGESWIDEGEQDGGDPLFRITQDYFFLHAPA